MSAHPYPATMLPREIALLDDAVWDVPAWLSPEAWQIEVGLDGHRIVGGSDDPEDDR